MIPRLVALTADARRAISGLDELDLTVFPFRFGRESREPHRRRPMAKLDRRLHEAPPNNEFYLLDFGEPLHISREHFQIERDEQRTYFVVDRGSACGTIVNSVAIGPHRQSAFAIIESGATILVGTQTTPYSFRFEV
jgi:hypothetical protein